MKSKSTVIAWGVISLLFGSILFFISRVQNNIEENYYNNYPLFKKDSSYQGVIIEKHYTRGRTFFRLNDSTKHSIIFKYNYDFNPYYIGDFLMVGDSIIKKTNEDSLTIYRNDKMFVFTIEQNNMN